MTENLEEDRQYFGMRQAAEYVNVPLSTFRHHVRVQKRITPAIKGRPRIFSRDQLDDYKENGNQTSLTLDADTIFNSQEAAGYISKQINRPFKPQALAQHVYTLKNIRPDFCGDANIYSQEKLDRFVSELRRPGKPPPQTKATEKIK